jgi:TPR repeat protein
VASLAEQGDAKSQFNLGLMHENGQGVPQDYAAAVSWYRKAAEQGNALAQGNLGAMYANGQGVPQDYVTAHMWLNLVAAGGDKKAAQNRGKVAARMMTPQVAEAQKLAREWKPTSVPGQH